MTIAPQGFRGDVPPAPESAPGLSRAVGLDDATRLRPRGYACSGIRGASVTGARRNAEERS